MAFGGQLGPQVLDIVESWRPRKKYRSETKFQNDLKEYLNEQLSGGGGTLDPMGGQDIPVRREYGPPNADLAVDDSVGIEMKRELSNSQTNALRGQIENYLDYFSFVIVCTCGLRDEGAWRELKRKYEGGGGMMGMGQQGAVRFVYKNPDHFGEPPGGGGGIFGGGQGGGLF